MSVLDVLLFSGLWCLVFACSPPEYESTLAEKAHLAKAIAVGKIVGKYADPRFGYGGDGTSTAYTAAMEVHCTYKGEVMDAVINITEAGFIPGHCDSSDLDVDGEYLVLLYVHDGGEYTISGSQMDPATPDAQNLTSTCGLNLRYKPGFEKHTACPIPNNPDCPRKVPFHDEGSAVGSDPSGGSGRMHAALTWTLLGVCLGLLWA